MARYLVLPFLLWITAAQEPDRLSSSVSGPEDLPRVRGASVADSASGEWLRDKYIGFASYPEIGVALQALQDGMADAVVYDMPILRYLAR